MCTKDPAITKLIALAQPSPAEIETNHVKTYSEYPEIPRRFEAVHYNTIQVGSIITSET
jgi:hypothetical protein